MPSGATVRSCSGCEKREGEKARTRHSPISKRQGTLCLVLSLLAFPATITAQAAAVPVTFSGEVRVRTEVDRRTPGTSSDMVSLLRTRLGVLVAPSERVQAVVRISDSRAFGEETSTLTDASADRLDLHEGFIEWTSLAGTRLRVGRQELAYGDERLIGTVGWANVTRSFDGVQVRVPVGTWTVDGFGATLREFDAVNAAGADPRANEGRARDQSLFGAWATNGAHDLFAIVETRVAGSGQHDVFRRTVGGHATQPVGRFTLDATAALQFGTAVGSDDRMRDIGAWLISGAVARQFDGDLTPRLALQVDLLSGDNDPLDDRDGAFNTLYATNHKFYGFMDLILDPASQLARRGLVDIAVRGTLHPGAWQLGVDVHRFGLMEERQGTSGRTLGTEVDATLGRVLAKGLGLSTGASVFRPAGAATQPGIGLGDETLWWGYVQLTTSF